MPYIIPPYEDAKLLIEFSPRGGGARQAILEINTDDPAVPVIRIPLSGIGLSAVQIIPIKLDFGDVYFSQSHWMKIIVSNLGPQDLIVYSCSIKGQNQSDFGIDNFTRDVITPGSVALNYIKFSPKGKGFRSAILEIKTNDEFTPVIDVPLSGIGIPALQPDPLEINFMKPQET